MLNGKRQQGNASGFFDCPSQNPLALGAIS
jgi:hypothetical protein